MSYGHHNLKRGDRDRPLVDEKTKKEAKKRTWGGAENTPGDLKNPVQEVTIDPSTSNRLNVPEWVKQLQNDLSTLGFLIVGEPTGEFDLKTEWAVREFQIYAKMETVAKLKEGLPDEVRQGADAVKLLGQKKGSNPPVSVYVDSLESVTNAAPYTGPVSGVVNEGTRNALTHWMEENYRCPVVIEAWTTPGNKRTALFVQNKIPSVNIWIHNEVSSTEPRMFFRDFSGYYTFPQGRSQNEYHVFGTFMEKTKGSKYNGPKSVPPNHCWSEAELLPSVIKKSGTFSDSESSTFKVIRAVSEVECYGFLDSVNCYDNVFASFGPCHWTIASRDGRNIGKGELAAFFALLKHSDRSAYVKGIGFFGIGTLGEWDSGTGQGNGKSFFNSSQRKFEGYITQEKNEGAHKQFPLKENEFNYFRTWHWHFRFSMSGRTIDGYKKAAYDLARIRLRDIINTPWGKDVPRVNKGTAQEQDAKVGDIITSECGLAIILRWHVFRPRHMISSGEAGKNLVNALKNAKTKKPDLDWEMDVKKWSDDHEAAIIQGLIDEIPASETGFLGTISEVGNWPTWHPKKNLRKYQLNSFLSSLIETRNSFSFNSTGLPPAP